VVNQRQVTKHTTPSGVTKPALGNNPDPERVNSVMAAFDEDQHVQQALTQ